jgi:holo-[acyl-carrier protein] synthase
MAFMALSPGIDVIEVSEVVDSIRVHANRYLERVYTASELRESVACDGTPDPQRLAAQFAAKEATIKALRVGDDEPVSWLSISVCENRQGRPEVELAGRMRELADARGVSEIAVSVTRAGPHVAAVVLVRTSDAA